MMNCEKETIISFTEERDELADVYTCNEGLKNRLEYLLLQHPGKVMWHPRQYADSHGARYLVAREWVLRAVKKVGPKRGVSDAQREHLKSATEKAKEARRRAKEGL